MQQTPAHMQGTHKRFAHRLDSAIRKRSKSKVPPSQVPPVLSCDILYPSTGWGEQDAPQTQNAMAELRQTLGRGSGLLQGTRFVFTETIPLKEGAWNALSAALNTLSMLRDNKRPHTLNCCISNTPGKHSKRTTDLLLNIDKTRISPRIHGVVCAAFGSVPFAVGSDVTISFTGRNVELTTTNGISYLVQSIHMHEKELRQRSVGKRDRVLPTSHPKLWKR